jgi:hypothetical protein
MDFLRVPLSADRLAALPKQIDATASGALLILMGVCSICSESTATS